MKRISLDSGEVLDIRTIFGLPDIWISSLQPLSTIIRDSIGLMRIISERVLDVKEITFLLYTNRFSKNSVRVD